MRSLATLIEKCTITIDITGERVRISGKGLFGTLAVVALCALVIYYAPQFVALVR